MHLSRILSPILAALLLTGTANAHVRLTSPNGGESLQGGQVYQVTWFDLISHGPAVTYDVEYSTDSGDTFLPIVSGLLYTGGTSTYDWVVPNLDITTARIRVVMHADVHIIYDDVSDIDFLISTYYTSYGVGSEVSGLTPHLRMESEPRVG